MADAEEEKTPLQQKLDEFGEQLSKVNLSSIRTSLKNDILVYFLRLLQLFVWLYGLSTSVISMIPFMVAHGFVVLSIISKLLSPSLSLPFLKVYRLSSQPVLHSEQEEWQRRMPSFVHYHLSKHSVVHPSFALTKQAH